MLLTELIEKLQNIQAEIANDLGENAAEDAVIRLAIQPNYPMQHIIPDDHDLVYVVEEETDWNDQQVVAYIPEGGQLRNAPYLPGNVSDALGWR